MTDIQEWIDDSRAHADRAADHVANVAAGVERWTMKVPPTDTDTDTMLIGLLDGTLGQALDALQAVLDIHVAPEWVKVQRPNDRSRDICQECTTEDTLIMYPCRTVRAIQDAIGEQR